MLLTIQSIILLAKLNKIKNPTILNKDSENNSCEIISFSQLNYEIDPFGSYIYSKHKNTKTHKTRLDVLLHIEKEEFITISNDFAYSKIYLTHTGYNYIQILILLTIRFLYRSILTPIIVSILTTFFLNYFKK